MSVGLSRVVLWVKHEDVFGAGFLCAEHTIN